MQEVVKSVIQSNNKYLLLRRSPNSKFFADLWDLPGGKLEKDETLEQCIKRETQEETSFIVEPIEKIGDHTCNENNRSLHFNFFSVNVLSSDLKLSDDHTDYKWVYKEELGNMNLTPVVKIFFETK